MPNPLRHPPPIRRLLAVLATALALLAVLAGPAFPQGSASDPAASSPPEKLRFGVLFWHDSPNDAAAFKGIRDALVETKVPHEFIVRQADSDAVKAARLMIDHIDRKRADLGLPPPMYDVPYAPKTADGAPTAHVAAAGEAKATVGSCPGPTRIED